MWSKFATLTRLHPLYHHRNHYAVSMPFLYDNIESTSACDTHPANIHISKHTDTYTITQSTTKCIRKSDLANKIVFLHRFPDNV